MEEGELDLDAKLAASKNNGQPSHRENLVHSSTSESIASGEQQTALGRSKWESDHEYSDDNENNTTLRKRKPAKTERKRLKRRKETVTMAEEEKTIDTMEVTSKAHQEPLNQSSDMATAAMHQLSVKEVWKPRPQPQPPTIRRCGSVDRYERLNRIDEGSYGVVYRARDRETGEIVALKRLKCEHQDRVGFPVTDLREIHTLLWVKHENIVNVREIVVGSGTPPKVFIVMDFLEHDLKTLMTGMRSPFMQSEVKTLMLQLLSAVSTLHRNWIIHRDLKTSNLLMNNRGRVKVADFGLARKFGSPLNAMTIPVVTLWYRAPELLLGAKEYTTAVDMWSIGCIFGEMLLNEPMIPGRGEIDQLNKIFQLLGTPNEEFGPD
ncbi:kinase-like domain-containing protein [Syncephalis fuscata]|nr:kinase-like domain-containing protein [Syncephalis fuscata]